MTKRIYCYRGKNYSLNEISALAGVYPSTMIRRLNVKKMSVEEAVDTDKYNCVKRDNVKYMYNDTPYLARDLATILGVHLCTIKRRIKKGIYPKCPDKK